jgi:amino-acid N-acetyltransferase
LLEASGLPLDGAREHFGTYIVAELEGKLTSTGGLELYGNDALLRSVAVDPQSASGCMPRGAQRAVDFVNTAPS